MRLSEMAGLRLDDLDLDADVALVVGKGRRPRSSPFGKRTATALDRYLRHRRLGVSAATRADFLKELIGKRRGPAACQGGIVKTSG